jgi:farnesol dehydrogenase
MTTFITGVTSSIGRVLLKRLSAQGERMRVLVRKSSNLTGLALPGVEFVYGDVTDLDAIRTGMQGCQRVTHMAAIVGHNVPEDEWWYVNRDGSKLVLETAQDLNMDSMVQVSSLSVLGFTEPGELADESRPIDTDRHLTLYQKTKFAADELAREYAAQGLNVKIVYPAFGYGCSFASSHTSMQDQTLLRMASGQPTAIMGSGKNRLCLAYYKDTARGIQLAHKRGKAGEGYILGGENMTFPEIWKVIAALLGEDEPVRRIPLIILKTVSSLSRFFTGKSIFSPEFFEMIAYDWNFSSRKAERELGWRGTAFVEAIAETWSDYQAQGWGIKAR